MGRKSIKENIVEKEGHSQAEDVGLKSGLGYFGESMLPKLGVEEKVAEIAPTEKVRVDARKMYEDFTYRMQNGQYYHFEFESDKITKDDLRRFREYEAFTSMMNKVDVVTHVICTAGTKQEDLELRTGINTYRAKATYLKGVKAEEVFARLRRKKEEELSRDDLVEVIFSPILGGTMPKRDRVLEGINLLRSATTIEKEELSKMEAILYILAVKFLDKTELDEVKEKMAMTVLGEMIFKDGEMKGRTIGEAKGRMIGEAHRIKAIRRMHIKELGALEIADMLEDEEKYVQRVLDFIAENPDKGDLEIAQMLLEKELLPA